MGRRKGKLRKAWQYLEARPWATTGVRKPGAIIMDKECDQHAMHLHEWI